VPNNAHARAELEFVIGGQICYVGVLAFPDKGGGAPFVVVTPNSICPIMQKVCDLLLIEGVLDINTSGTGPVAGIGVELKCVGHG
jgi:hypothetical protein